MTQPLLEEPTRRYCAYGTVESTDGVWEADPTPLGGKKAKFRPGGDAKLKSILVRAALANEVYRWRDITGRIMEEQPSKVIEILGWTKALSKKLIPKEPVKAKAKPQVPVRPVGTIIPITYDEAIKEGMEVVEFAAQKHYKTNRDVYGKAQIAKDDLVQHLLGEVLTKKYLVEIEGGFQWFAAEERDPWNIEGFRSSLYKSCWRACLAHHRKHIAAQKRSPGLRDGSVLNLDAGSSLEDDDEGEVALSGAMATDERAFFCEMVDSLYEIANGVHPHHPLAFPHQLAVMMLHQSCIVDAQDKKGLSRARQYANMKATAESLHSDFMLFFEQAWAIVRAHVRTFIADRIQAPTGGMLTPTQAPDTMDRVHECPNCTVEGIHLGEKVQKPRMLATYECHREGNTLFCPCGGVLQRTEWVSRKH